ncbi:MAG TPA: acyl-CoA dehydrogenase, partial [Gammaproteobacteria bacterium]|nr:acyl-CoA dehydrogenase [Gammaproteobacteria bacterium]
MDLAYSPEYEQYRMEVRQFLDTNKDQSPPLYGRGNGDGIARDWQKLLIENGYAARTIPKEYG